jgi:hypothetical protein
MKKVILIFASSVILTGCASTSTAMQSWVGHHITELYLSWGPPSSTMSDGQGGTMISYYYNRDLGQIPGTAVRNYDGSVSYTAPTFVNSTAVRTFFANSQGIIYSWRWQGY